VSQWLKPKAAGSGYASTFTMMLDGLDERRNNAERRGKNRRGGKKQQQQPDDKQQGATDSNKIEKTKK
jgi:hypothetical protein